MSKSAGQLVGGAVGFVVGSYFGNGQLGYAIGSAIGGYVDPVKNFGPRLQDAAQQTAIDGVPISFGYGTYPTTGNVIWRSPLREVKKKKREGKGGSAVNITYTYLRSYAIGVCEGPITGFLQVKKNGKIVYDARPDADLLALGYTADQVKKIRVAQAKFLNNVELYLGDESQEPDPTIESHEGIGNVAPFRGLAYIVVEEDDVTAAQGAIPQYEFVVSACGTTGTSGGLDPPTWVMVAGDRVYESEDGLNFPGDYYQITTDLGLWSADVATRLYRRGTELVFTGGETAISHDNGSTWVGFPTTMDLSGGAAAIVNGGLFVSSGAGPAWRISGGVQSITPWSSTELVSANGELITSSNGGFGELTNRGTDGNGTFTKSISIDATNRLVRLYSDGSNVLIYWCFWDLVPKLSYTSNGAYEIYPLPCPFTSDPSHFSEFAACFSPGLQLWVVVVGRQIAYGPSLSTLQLSSTTLTFAVKEVHEDGEKFVLTGENRGALSSIDGNVWSTVPPPPGVTVGQSVRAIERGDGGIPDGSEPIPDAPGWFVGPDGIVYGPGSEYIDRCRPVLGSIVADLCLRSGLTSSEFDVSDLTDLVDGFRIHGEAGVDAMIAPLMQAYFFDVTEYDGKVRFVKRGGDAVMSVGPDDLVERDGDAVEWERVQEAELLRKVTVAAFCPEAGFARSTQEAELRSATVDAKGESLTELPIVCTKDELAQIADKRKKAAWSEPDKCRFTLPYRLSALTPCDVLHLYDDEGNFKRIRLSSGEVDTGCSYIEASLDRRSAYTSSAVGVSPPPPLIVDPPVIGPTTAAIINVPIWTNDDELGVYIAAMGVFAGWNGANIEFSTDGGANYSDAGSIDEAATIGSTLTGLLAEFSSEYLASQTLDVALPDAPSSVDYATLLRYFNRAAVQRVDGSWEILQYQMVTTIGSGQYRLSGLVRGRYATQPAAIASGARFVLLDSSVKFIQTPSFMLGSTLLVRVSSIGTTPDAATPQTFTYNVGMSQREWAPFYLEGSRDGSDNVSLSWIGRARLGTSRRPTRSKYFAGYAVEVDDGTTVTVTRTLEATFQITSAADPVTVRVAAVNSITGVGPYSEAITV